LRTATIFILNPFPQIKSAWARLILALTLFLAVGATAETTNDSVEAIIQGRKLALHLLEQRPAENATQTGLLKIRDAEGNRLEIPIKIKVSVTSTNWQSIYEVLLTNATEILTVTHYCFPRQPLEGDFPSLETQKPENGFPDNGGNQRQYIIGLKNILVGTPNTYSYSFPSKKHELAVNELWKDHLIPFAQSDFWQCDLGLEFFHWPQQKVLPKTTNLKRGREYTLLESTNPNPATNGYSRVLTWIDKESGGILEAEAYDFNGKLLKDFAPKSFKKVNGQWELQEMEIRNVQTGSRTRLEFDLKK
jgi:hypothetical protein